MSPRMHQIGKAGVVGGGIGFTAVTFVVFVVCSAAGMAAGDSFGLAVWAGFWGGIGFGAMIGSTAGANTAEAAERESEVSSS
jgi:hypothetical protein